jgi:hypothetical protein
MLLVGFCLLSFVAIGQINTPEAIAVKQAIEDENVTLTKEQAALMFENEELLKVWVKALTTPGVVVEGDQMTFSKEAIRLIKDTDYRNSVYKDVYVWEDVVASLTTMEIQKSFWQMINMYPDNRDKVLQYIYFYDRKIPSDEVVTAAFYTYAFFDPKITNIENGKPNIYRPDLFEEYLRRTKEIVGYIAFFREQEEKTKMD